MKSLSLLAAPLLLTTACDEHRPPPVDQPPAVAPAKSYLRANDPRELLGICTDDPRRDHAGTPYVKGSTMSPVALFVQWGEDAEFEAWGRGGTLATWDASETGATQLVACVRATNLSKARSCPYVGATLELFDATYQISIRDAHSGKELAKKDYPLKVRDCPEQFSFAYGQTSSYNGPSMSDAIAELVLPLQPPAGALPPPSVRNDLLFSCEGAPLPRQAAYAPSPATPSPLFAFFEPQPGAGFGEAKRRNRDEPAFMSLRDEPPFTLPDDQIGSYQLVACVAAKPGPKVLKSCKFGWSGEKVLELHDGEVEVLVREAKTAKEIGRSSFPATSKACPETWSFPSDGTKDVSLGVDRKALQAWLTTLTTGQP